jgi:hypothetical protein
MQNFLVKVSTLGAASDCFASCSCLIVGGFPGYRSTCSFEVARHIFRNIPGHTCLDVQLRLS